MENNRNFLGINREVEIGLLFLLSNLILTQLDAITNLAYFFSNKQSNYQKQESQLCQNSFQHSQ